MPVDRTEPNRLFFYHEITHVCCVCAWKFHSENRRDALKVIAAAKVNKDGPYCALCLHLEMAARYAFARGHQEIRVIPWGRGHKVLFRAERHERATSAARRKKVK